MVLLDRYYPSTAAYQGTAGLDVTALLEQNSFAPFPDVVLVLDLSPDEGLRRIGARGDSPNHFEIEVALAAARKIFLSMPLPTRRVIDASRSFDTVGKAAWVEILVVVTKKAKGAFGTRSSRSDPTCR